MGHVEVERAVAAQGPASDDPPDRVEGFMFSARQSSRFEPDGLLLYFDLALQDGTGAQMEIDLPRQLGRDPVVHYTEEIDGRLTFESDSATGAVELAEDLDGRLCSCSDGRFDLRLRDDGADGEAGTADDQVRELRNGVYRWDARPCARDGQPEPVPLADLDRVEVRPVDHCMGRPEAPEPSSTATPSTRSVRDPDSVRHGHGHDPFYDHHTHHVIYAESYGCGAGPNESAAASSSGCGGGSSYESDSEASGCEGDTQSSSASGCGNDSTSDGLHDGGGSSGCGGSGNDDSGGSSSGCQGDDHDSSSGCDSDTSSSSATLAPMCGPRTRPRPHLLAGPFQNYLWIALAAAFTSPRARRRKS